MTPTGSVFFKLDEVLQQAVHLAVVNGQTQAVFTSALQAGTHTVDAIFSYADSFPTIARPSRSRL